MSYVISKVFVFSAMHVSGEQLALYTGVAAILRFPIPDIDLLLGAVEVDQKAAGADEAAQSGHTHTHTHSHSHAGHAHSHSGDRGNGNGNGNDSDSDFSSTTLEDNVTLDEEWGEEDFESEGEVDEVELRHQVPETRELRDDLGL
jgi:hypothetical protein